MLLSLSNDHSLGSPDDRPLMTLSQKNFNFSAIPCRAKLKSLPYTHPNLLYQITYSKRLDDVETDSQVFRTVQVGPFLSDVYLELGPIGPAETSSLASIQCGLSSATKGNLELLSGMTKRHLQESGSSDYQSIPSAAPKNGLSWM
jgi:hypothetical protein